MGLLRSIFRLGKRRAAEEGGSVPDPPIYPPEDTLTFGFEEIFVTLALLILSYVVLATPCFSKRRREGRSPESRTDAAGGGWTNDTKRIRHVRNGEDLKRWWRRLWSRRRGSGGGSVDDRDAKFDPRRWEEALMRSTNSGCSNDGEDSDRTVRAKGGRSAPSTPLRKFFRHTTNGSTGRGMYPSASDGYLVGSPVKAERGGGRAIDGESSFYEEDFRPETDHDRFKQAWRSHIRLAEYRRLVLPPECKLVEFVSQRETEHHFLENLLVESKLNNVVSYARSIFDILCGAFSKEGTRRFSVWIIGIFRYTFRKQRGLAVEDDEETDDDDDDGSVTTLVSNSGKMAAKVDIVPVASNQANPSGRHGKGASLDNAPRLCDNKSHQENGHGNENDSSFINVPYSASSEKKRDYNAEKGTPRSRSDTADLNDDATFISAIGLENTDASLCNSFSSVPSSVEQRPKNDLTVSPLPMRPSHKPKKRDALENYRQPDLKSIRLPALKPASDPDPLPKRVNPKPSQKINPQNPIIGLNDEERRDSNNMNFFDTANSDRQLRDMSRAVPIPDTNGYILGDEFLGSSCTPLLVFVNSRSGPQQGHLLITQFRRLLNPIQVWDLANGGPEKVLKSYSVLSRFQILVCGGDGTVSWIISALEGMGLKRWPPIGILPLGTGNDLARIHGWGGGYNNESLLFILRQLSEAYISMLDLWELEITSMTKKGKQKKGAKAFLNYLGIGVDAQAALQVHLLRESKPKLFFSRVINKLHYAIAGGEEALKSSCANISQHITLLADGIEVPLPPDSQGIIFLNIDSYSGGVPIWSKGFKPLRKRVRRYSESDGFARNDSVEDLAELATAGVACDLPSSCQDGLLDVVSIRGTFHLGQIRVGLSNAQLICQCREATVTLKKKIAVQIDGEPWRQNPSTLRIVRKPDRATMLNRSAEDKGGVETEVTQLLNWANERDVIDRNQYALMMEEFSRRNKKRKQKQKGNGFPFIR